ncbi:MAG TPA: carboxylating nicotinate-nucleotide diphosphorylase [bacterium]|nr:carboxylating nicotinate-nucleotide diphosphorylase [bacterium]
MPFYKEIDLGKLQQRLREALHEDIGNGDVTTAAVVPRDRAGESVVIVKEDGVVCGLPILKEIYRLLDESVVVEPEATDGDRVTAGQRVARIQGPLLSILLGERVGLNFLGWLSGVATLTRRFVDSVSGRRVEICDTRKTTPLWRDLQKYAVRMGGGKNHRNGLYDMVLIKENHIDAAGGIREAVRRVRDRWGDRYAVEVETRNLEEVIEAIEANVDRIMLDNFPIDKIASAVQIVGGKCKLEVSGRVTLETVERIARTGVDIISVGALTHSSAVLDYTMLVQEKRILEEGPAFGEGTS